MRLDQVFNAEEMPESSSPNALPAGWQTFTIKDAEVKVTKNGTGQYIKLRMDVTGGDFDGRVIFENVNVRNANEVAERIGRQQLGEIMRAIGLASVSDTDEFIGGTLMAKLAVKKDAEYGDENGEVNVIKSFKAVDGSTAPAPKPAQTAEKSPTAPSGGVKPPWAK